MDHKPEPKRPKTEDSSAVAKPTTITDPNNVIYTDSNGVKYQIWPPPPGVRLRSAQVNCMTYTDDKGVEREIYLPQGTAHTAWDHLENERWEELEKFEEYAGQGYTEEDFKRWEERSCKPIEKEEEK
ncbi:hypothetical protein B0T20DRAFT_411952 [Sordaria brevicollis]|uniref:Uncharacterized protein n=1 Tax=Sordaria brevicollis TaxID=83679 RepID=A0AAE0PF16_SORBR|nr:hypothetical protein B0T20DRAFT_411952 [Sordaria brevicollis]